MIQLPDDLIRSVCCYLPVEDILQLELTCKRFNNVQQYLPKILLAKKQYIQVRNNYEKLLVQDILDYGYHGLVDYIYHICGSHTYYKTKYEYGMEYIGKFDPHIKEHPRFEEYCTTIGKILSEGRSSKVTCKRIVYDNEYKRVYLLYS